MYILINEKKKRTIANHIGITIFNLPVSSCINASLLKWLDHGSLKRTIRRMAFFPKISSSPA
jgi:hypothetical protein